MKPEKKVKKVFVDLKEKKKIFSKVIYFFLYMSV